MNLELIHKLREVGAGAGSGWGKHVNPPMIHVNV